jgi:hypothetical protein
MKISVLGKSGPRVVTTGLVCAGAAVGTAAIQPATASTNIVLTEITDISILPDRFWFATFYHEGSICRAF